MTMMNEVIDCKDGYARISINVCAEVSKDFRHVCAAQNIPFSRVMQRLMRDYVTHNSDLLKTPPHVPNMVRMRLNAGMTQKELADAIGVDQGRISRYETRVVKPGVRMLQRIAEALSCSPVDLLD